MRGFVAAVAVGAALAFSGAASAAKPYTPLPAWALLRAASRSWEPRCASTKVAPREPDLDHVGHRIVPLRQLGSDESYRQPVNH